MREKILLALAITLSIFALVNTTKTSVFSGVPVSAEYMSTTTRSSVNGTALATGQLLANGSGTLGSVVITGAGAGTINLYDATSTITNSQYGTTTLVTIPASAVAGTYTFDVVFNRGLVYEFLGTAPTTTITWRK